MTDFGAVTMQVWWGSATATYRHGADKSLVVKLGRENACLVH